MWLFTGFNKSVYRYEDVCPVVERMSIRHLEPFQRSYFLLLPPRTPIAEVAGAVQMAHVSTAMQLHAAAEQRRLKVPNQHLDPAAWARRLAVSVGFAEQWRLISSAFFLVRQVAERALLHAAATGGGGPRAKPAFLQAVAELKEVWDAAYDLGRSERGPQAGASFRNLIQLIIKVISQPPTLHHLCAAIICSLMYVVA